MEGRRGQAVGDALTALDRVYLRRACELALRGRGSTSPNPPVGAVIVDAARTLGEGFHRAHGEPHAEVEALRDAAARGHDVGGATLYVSLEPCAHTGRTGPCTQAAIDAGIARVVAGVRDPNPKASGGLARLGEAGVAVADAGDPWAAAIVEEFTGAVRARERPFVRLKLAVSLDGFVAPRPGERHWLTGEPVRDFVRELRASHDAVLVGAGTVRVDDPDLTVRPPRSRRIVPRRIVACEHAAVPADRKIFAPADGYGPTIVLAPAGLRDDFLPLEAVADVVYVGEADARALDLEAALRALRSRGIASILCEGGPTLAGHLLERKLVDRVEWLTAPVLLSGGQAVRALGPAQLGTTFSYETVERLGADLRLSFVPGGAACSAG